MNPWLYPVVYVPMLMAFLLLVLSMRNPSPAGMTGGKMEPAGVLRITRHPMNMGLACFGLARMIANGSLGDVFFGSIFIVGFFGPYHQDRRKVREKGEAHVAFQKETGVLPFAAAILFHEDLFGVRPCGRLYHNYSVTRIGPSEYEPETSSPLFFPCRGDKPSRNGPNLRPQAPVTSQNQ